MTHDFEERTSLIEIYSLLHNIHLYIYYFTEVTCDLNMSQFTRQDLEKNALFNISFDTLNFTKRSIRISKSTTNRILEINHCIAKLIEGVLSSLHYY